VLSGIPLVLHTSIGQRLFMNTKQIVVICGLIGIIALSLLFPPKVLKRDGRVIMRFAPLETKKFQSRGILIQAGYRDPNLECDWQRLAFFIALVILAGGTAAYIFRDKRKIESS